MNFFNPGPERASKNDKLKYEPVGEFVERVFSDLGELKLEEAKKNEVDEAGIVEPLPKVRNKVGLMVGDLPEADLVKKPDNKERNLAILRKRVESLVGEINLIIGRNYLSLHPKKWPPRLIIKKSLSECLKVIKKRFSKYKKDLKKEYKSAYGMQKDRMLKVIEFRQKENKKASVKGLREQFPLKDKVSKEAFREWEVQQKVERGLRKSEVRIKALDSALEYPNFVNSARQIALRLKTLLSSLDDGYDYKKAA